MPQPFGPSSAKGLDQLAIEQAGQVNNQLSQIRPVVDPTKPKGQQRAMLTNLQQQFDQTGQILDDDQQDVTHMMQDVEQSGQMAQSNGVLASSYFSLKTFAQLDGGSAMGLAAAPPEQTLPQESQQQPQDQQLSFGSDTELKEWLTANMSNHDAINQFLSSIPSDSEFQGDTGNMGNVQQFVKDSIQRFTQPDTDEAQRSILAAQIFEKMNGQSKENEIPAQYTQASIESIDKIISNAEKIIQQFARKAASQATVKTASSFNLKKEAQFRRGTEFLNFGPESTRVLPGGKDGYLASDWHVRERNKAHDFNFDDNYFVDFDTFWRGNIMDKYSQPYRNAKGEWVGGYLNKRFETDHNIPEGNNHQLLPGQRRRPILPEFGSTESRLEASRKEMAKDRGYSPTDDKGSPYNWKEATVKKK